VKKPINTREGANVKINARVEVIEAPGEYGEEGFILQAYHALPEFSGNHTVIGSWIVGEEPAGIGIREDESPITKNSSRFVPHYFA
jgi:glutathionylspermidine synthase